MKNRYYSLFVLLIILMSEASCSKDKNDDLEATPDIALNKSSLFLEKGKEERLIASFTPADTPNQGHRWSSSAPDIAMVDETGMVSGVAFGESTITVIALSGGKTAKCQVKVIDKIINVTGVSLSETEATLLTGEKIQLEATIQPSTATDKSITWRSSDNEIASVDGKGVVTAISEGETIIKAITNDSEKIASCKIIVRGKGVDISKPKISSITSNSVYIEGTVKTFGLHADETGICYSTSQMPTIDNTKIVLSNTNIGYTLKKLAVETTYYVRIYAKVEGAIHYGEQGVFTTTGILKTHFAPTDIYENKITLVSSGVSGINQVNVCYGKYSNPKITDNVTTATKGSDGKYHVSLTGLDEGTTYYLRSYSMIGSNIEYNDDVVSAQTIGKDFKFSRKIDKYESYYIPEYRVTRYRVYSTYTYNIKIAGTYSVATRYSTSAIAKTTDYSSLIYIQSGTGTFSLKQEAGIWSYDGPSTYVDFQSDQEIDFTNLENKIRYHIVVPRRCYVRSY